ncbi:hypothetical protein CTheo_491 [Ceratobasidium theobromae]|uniref:Uncharacterized protein n=1 Tax=Ceratobasidium theobromae TaxID=1582974 RepID=A0A5N5QWA4_9AGAM|nr:hypothetical protein CTheo_491 [Ceratobasidium theobromae]
MGDPFRRDANVEVDKLAEEVRDTFSFIETRGGVPSRWRSFWIRTEVPSAHFVAIELLKSSPMPLLQRLEMLCGATSRLDEEGEFIRSDINDSPPALLFHEPPPPQLHVIKLEGVPDPLLFGHPSHPQLVNLTRLELQFFQKHPALDELNKMLTASPQLTTLLLDSGWVDPPDDPLTELDMSLPKIHLPELRELSFRDVQSVLWNLSILMMLDAPNVESFRLDMFDFHEPEVISQINKYLTRSGSDDGGLHKPCFPSLAHLTYENFGDADDDLRVILPAYPGLTSLEVPSGGSLRPLLEQPWHVPSLTHLIVASSGDMSVLKKVVITRHKADLPLKMVQIKLVDKGCYMSPYGMNPRDWKQVEKLVKVGFVDEDGGAFGAK